MWKYWKSGTAAAALTLMTSGSLSAATVTSTFTFTSLPGQIAPQLVFMDGLLTLTVSALHYANISTIGTNATITGVAPAVQVGINNNGIGVCAPNGAGTGCKAGDLLDGGSNNSTTDNEMLSFAFNQSVKVTSVSWNNNDTNDLVDLFIGPNYTLTNQFTAAAPPSTTNLLGIGPLSTFGLGLQDKSDELRVAELSITYETTNPPPPPPVPLPAAGVLLLGGVGALASLRRRRAAKD